LTHDSWFEILRGAILQSKTAVTNSSPRNTVRMVLPSNLWEDSGFLRSRASVFCRHPTGTHILVVINGDEYFNLSPAVQNRLSSWRQHILTINYCTVQSSSDVIGLDMGSG